MLELSGFCHIDAVLGCGTHGINRSTQDSSDKYYPPDNSASMKSLSDLQAPDDRSLHFSPLGLFGRIRPEDAAEFQQRVVTRHELVPAVAEGTRQSFDQLREIFAYGLLCYDIFTVINDRALLVLEQALRDRFIDFHDGTVTLVSSLGQSGCPDTPPIMVGGNSFRWSRACTATFRSRGACYADVLRTYWPHFWPHSPFESFRI
jgi:hypothetical protein